MTVCIRGRARVHHELIKNFDHIPGLPFARLSASGQLLFFKETAE